MRTYRCTPSWAERSARCARWPQLRRLPAGRSRTSSAPWEACGLTPPSSLSNSEIGYNVPLPIPTVASQLAYVTDILRGSRGRRSLLVSTTGRIRGLLCISSAIGTVPPSQKKRKQRTAQDSEIYLCGLAQVTGSLPQGLCFFEWSSSWSSSLAEAHLGILYW